MYSPLPSTISGGRIVKPISTCSKLAKTRKELKEILFEDKEFFDGDCLRLLEVRMNRLDAPLALTKQAKESARLNSEWNEWWMVVAV